MRSVNSSKCSAVNVSASRLALLISPGPGWALRWSRPAALSAIAALVIASAAASFAESYRGLFLWAEHHDLSGFWAAAFPLQLDVFIAVGELVLFIAMTDRWNRRDRAGAWAVTGVGLIASVLGNVGHAAGGDLAARMTAAVPPVAAAAALALALGVVKRVTAERESDPGPVAVEVPVPVEEVVPSTAREAAKMAHAASVRGRKGNTGRPWTAGQDHRKRPPGQPFVVDVLAELPSVALNGHRRS